MKTEQKQKEESMDDIYHEAVRHVRSTGYVSPAAIQRTFVIGYNRAARLIEDMERNGVVSKPDAETGRRDILKRPACQRR